MEEVALNYIIVARQLVTKSSYQQAFEMYLCAFNKQPRIKKRFEIEFRAVLSRMNERLAAADNKADIFANFEQAIKMFPGNVDILNDIGRYLYRYGYFSEALCHFEKALNIDNSFVSIEKNLNNAKSFLFPRSRFRVINDKVRNDAYRRAIRSSVNPAADSVLDIDGGTGLLALYANECDPIVITACESSTTMARLAECVMEENDAQAVVIVNKPSVILKHADIYGSRSVLLTDMIDAGLFGEYILQSLCHAWENLLHSESRVIPGRAEYFVAGVQCEELNKKFKLNGETKAILNVGHMEVHTATYFGETYYSDDVGLFKNLKYISEPQPLFTIDFNDHFDVHDKLYTQDAFTADLKATSDGDMNLVVGWFNLHLTDDIMITNDPRSDEKSTAWQQAVFFDVLPKTVRKNEIRPVHFLTYGGRLATLPDVGVAISRISPDTLAFLNDIEYITMIKNSVAVVCLHLGQTVCISEVDMVDFCPFPLFGVLMMKRGANSLICHAKTIDDKAFLKKVLQANDIPEDKVTILLSEYWSHEVFKNKQFHVIFSNIIEFNGDIDARRKRMIQHLKHTHLISGGICLPESVTVIGQLINSNWLEVNNRVLDENVGYKMAKHVNRYQVSQALYLDIARLDYIALSEAFEISCCDQMTSEVIKVPVLEDGDCTAVLCWYKVQMFEGWSAVYTNRGNSFVESMAHLATASMKVFCGDQVNVLKCVDPDGSFKLVVDLEPY
ncbi:unnamed protein product [Chrysodeixis includens]|uniref:Protein arginine N-methyltransferase 9-like n=1 Tax=Chrysodeixis includens TaxID=689277 RepID=A0A9P0FX83_CHRIL|nr:unnamed protein product [Chrysodeixis includens]